MAAIQKPSLLARTTMEFVSTFFLLLTISMVVAQGPDMATIAPLAIGLVLLTLVYMGGPICGAHYNPAVTICLSLTGRSPWRDAIPYILAQIIGAIAAALVAMSFQEESANMANPAPTAGFVAEAIWSFLLVFVILQVTSTRQAGNPWYGIAIGMTVSGGAWVMGPISGAVFNPAIWCGLALEDKLPWDQWWLYVFAPVTGGLCAVGVDWITSMTTSEVSD